MGKKHIPGYHLVLDQVAREIKFLLAVKAPPLNEVRRTILKKLRDKETQMVAMDGERMVGWCNIRPDTRPGTSHVGLLYMGVIKKYRKMGVGAKLLERSLRHAEWVRGFECVQLEVYASNYRAINLYKKYGFTVDGLRKKARKHQGKYEDILLMSKPLKNGMTKKQLKEHLKVFERNLASRNEKLRWQGAVELGEFLKDYPELVWSMVVKYGSKPNEDLRMAVATCLLEHLLEHHFKKYLPKVEKIILSGNRNFRDTFKHCWKYGQAQTPLNSLRWGRLLKNLEKK